MGIIVTRFEWDDRNVGHMLARHNVTPEEVEEASVMAKLPKFRSEEEEAEFWATHDLTEFEEDLEPADVQSVRPDQVVAVRLNKEDVEALKQAARRKGIGYTTLVRMWVRERLEKERA